MTTIVKFRCDACGQLFSDEPASVTLTWGQGPSAQVRAGHVCCAECLHEWAKLLGPRWVHD